MKVPNTEQRERDCANAICSPTEAYVYWLRKEFCAASPGHWNSDPTQPCLLYKVYHDTERFPLDVRFPLRLGSSEVLFTETPAQSPWAATPAQLLAWLLYLTHGLTRFIRPAPASLPTHARANTVSYPRIVCGQQPRTHPSLGRPVPSGGSLHPVEIYLVIGQQWGFPPGVYHYDSVRHALDLLRKGDYLAELASLLPQSNDLRADSAVILPAVFFQKNHQKYTNLSYRLQTLDTGIVVEQLRLVARFFGLQGSIFFQFLDHPLHHLVGLDVHEEGIYAAMTLQNTAPLTPSLRENAAAASKPASPAAPELRQTISSLPPVTASYLQPFKPLERSALLDALHQASLLEALPEAPVILPVAYSYTPQSSPLKPDDVDCGSLPLTETTGALKPDLASVLLRLRRTGFNAIDTSPLSSAELGNVLNGTSKISGELWHICDCRLYCVIARSTDLAAGVYRYHPASHKLTPVHSPRLFPLLSRLPTAPNIHPHLAPVNIFLTGNYVQARRYAGERGFRLLGIEAGRVIQRLSLAAASCGLVGHIHLSYFLDIAQEPLLHLPSTSHLPLVCFMLGKPRHSQDGLLEMLWY